MSGRLGTLWRVAAAKPRKLARKRISASVRAALDADAIIAVWWQDLPNWGDIVNPVLIEHLSGRRPVAYEHVFNLANRPVYSVIGSVLDRASVLNLEVWGSGFKDASSRFWLKPRRIHAVRGPLTREVIIRQGLSCPAVYGDPALLYPRFYRPSVERRHALGVVPHYADVDHPQLLRLRERGDVHVIDILAGVREVADQICSCDAIASSSLHGMVLADAYGIPSRWIRFSDRVEGSGFKFEDYLAGVNRRQREPLTVTDSTTPDVMLAELRADPVDVDLDRLLTACPFLREDCRTA